MQAKPQHFPTKKDLREYICKPLNNLFKKFIYIKLPKLKFLLIVKGVNPLRQNHYLQISLHFLLKK